MEGKHWHCTHCHRQCKTIKCRDWCHKKFCGKHYEKLLKAKRAIGRVSLKEGQPVIPQYATAVEGANKALYQAEKATTDEEFRQANRGLTKVLDEQRADYDHFNGQQQVADAIDAASYPSEKERKAIDDQNYNME